MSSIGQRVILPSSFTGGSRYMMQNYLDAMDLCRWFGFPDFFITITCNPKWSEVKRFLNNTTINLEDRPDIMCRLFKVKLDAIIKDLKKGELLGKVQAIVYTMEFQKRGLPHAHIFLFMHADHKLPTVDHINPFVSAEIPDKKEDPELYSLVSDHMMHGPCGYDNMNCSCMINRRCSKNFPKKFTPHNSIDSNGYPIYRRRYSGRTVKRSNVDLDNRGVVPYNKTLLKIYQAHINVEWCNQAASIKYLFKYSNKGPDRAIVEVVDADNQDDQVQARDEIREYYDCRYLSACEAAWRIFAFEVHYNSPSVIRLPFHLPGQQQVMHGPDDDIDNVLNKPSVGTTKAGFSIGRIHQVSPSLGEAYFLRILLNKVKGPKSFEDIRTVYGQTFPTVRDACYALGLLDDDTEYIEAIKEASASSSGYYLRALFRSMLLSSSLSKLDFVWEKTWEYLSDGIIYTQQRILNIPGGRTAHSRFHIPINLNEDSTCSIKPGSDDAHLLKEAKLIIWDEAPMIHKYAFEALDRTMTDVLTPNTSIDSGILFGGKVIVFGGDFRQVLPVLTNGSRQHIVNASLCSSYIWGKCKLLRLTKNMRLTIGAQTSDIDMEQTKQFAKWLLDIGEGNVGGLNDGETTIDIPDDLLINDSALLAPTNEDIQDINDRLLSLFPRDEKEYLSSDSICPTEDFVDLLQANLYSPDVLNGLKISGLPNHRLVLKVGALVMLLRNIDHQIGLCNGTRLRVMELKRHVIVAEIISGGKIGTRTYIHRLNMIPIDNKIPFKFQRRQFPISVCFAMTINKSQGQSLSKVGLYLKHPVFRHGQLYVALSRVKSRDGVKLLILDIDGKLTNRTSNVVYKEIFRDLYKKNIDYGLLNYLHTDHTQGISVRRSELVGLIMRRNELASDHLKASKTQQLPPMLQPEPVVFDAVFHLGVFPLNPRPLNALSSDGVIVLVSSSDESSPREEHYIDNTPETSAVMRPLAYLERKREHRSSKEDDAEGGHANAEEELVKKMRASGPK
ncbi:uncharacterized protein LOC143572322 [Bidens hawaiensis]|uniref:uncharacterized protein LOC143572322 n=1 Tax=Bidens hawaiensis TaxID=980011 RepID=UPI00404B2596